ncbi:MAG: hypothetical protein WBB48_07985 [Thermodesulfobacteriota bacterium]
MSLSPIKLNQAATIFILLLIILLCFSTHNAISENTDSSTLDENSKNSPDDGFVELQNDMDLIELIKTISEINNETYILDESVKPQNVSIITPEGGMKKEDFLKFFDIILNLNGLSVVKSEGINKVISSKNIIEESTPTIIELDK